MRKAFLIGINGYSTQKSLRGCLTDVSEMQSLLSEVFSFDQVETLTERNVNKDALTAAIDQTLQPETGETDGVRVLFFAGHGGRVFDRSQGNEPDHIDENLCMPNYNWADDSTYLVDDEFGVALKASSENAPFLRIYVVLDSCHSGTATRAVESDMTWENKEEFAKANFGTTDLPSLGFTVDDPVLDLLAVTRQATDDPALEERTATDAQELIASTFAKDNGSPTTHLLLSGCSAAQTCKDVPLEDAYHGIFTYTLTRVARSNPAQTWTELRSSVSDVIAENFSQHPQLEGPEGLQYRSIFS